MSEDVMLQIKGLSKSFGKNKVLDGINLTVKRGSVLALWARMEPASLQ